jgi:hypothetical protein
MEVRQRHATSARSLSKNSLRMLVFLVLLTLVFLCVNLSMPVHEELKEPSDTRMAAVTLPVITPRRMEQVQVQKPLPAPVSVPEHEPEELVVVAETAVVEKVPEVCAAWGCTCKGAVKKYKIWHRINFGIPMNTKTLF